MGSTSCLWTCIFGSPKQKVGVGPPPPKNRGRQTGSGCVSHPGSGCQSPNPKIGVPKQEVGASSTQAVGAASAKESRTSAKELEEAGLAVGLGAVLLEGALGQRAQAEGTDKVLGVEAPRHGGDAAPGDGAPAPAAQRPAALVVVALTVGAAPVLEEAALRKGRVALLGSERGGQGSPPSPGSAPLPRPCPLPTTPTRFLSLGSAPFSTFFPTPTTGSTLPSPSKPHPIPQASPLPSQASPPSPKAQAPPLPQAPPPASPSPTPNKPLPPSKSHPFPYLSLSFLTPCLLSLKPCPYLIPFPVTPKPLPKLHPFPKPLPSLLRTALILLNPHLLPQAPPPSSKPLPLSHPKPHSFPSLFSHPCLLHQSPTP